MDKWDKHNQWLKETRISEEKLHRQFRQYINISLAGVNLDGSFTPDQLREIADVVEERIKAKEN
ncbi:hypothetical protein LCGC14_1249460 [marine sediment metagenome]|uniref:Uncharacterized protein n=1 Tax=marine sediment metagenome TaxID=412755 RepID=A0A0F9LQF3_9ZZZZ